MAYPAKSAQKDLAREHRRAVNGSGDERELVRRCQAGDPVAFEALFNRHMAMVYRQAIRMLGDPVEAEEVVQEVFVTVYKKIGLFRGEAAFSTWLYRLTANAAITKLRKRKRSREISIEDYLPAFQDNGHHQVRPVVDWSVDLEKMVTTKETQAVIREALDCLPPVDKAVVVLSDVEELSNRDIAQALGLTVPAVKARLHRARLFLRGKLAAHFGHSPT
jgi:RNA polymerase sigma-70 factor (ECF subfamily)